MRYALIFASLLISSAAQAETRIYITPAYQVETVNGLFVTYRTITSPSGVVYFEPGSKMERGHLSFMQGDAKGGGPRLCADGKPARMLATFPGGQNCAADRPQ